MNAIVFVFAAVLAVAHAGVIPITGAIHHSIIEPSVQSTHLQGPGTSTRIVGPDGSQINADAPGGIVNTAQHAAVATDVVAPVVAAYSAPVVAHHAAYVPAVVAHHGLAYAAAPVVALPAGHGIEGQYVHDYTEKLYDDGSYHGEIY